MLFYNVILTTNVFLITVGVGEQGVSAILSSLNHQKYEELYKVNGFNALLSDNISLNRSIPDIRHKL